MIVKETLQQFDKFLFKRGLRFEAVVIGGAALDLLGVISRPTKDSNPLSCNPSRNRRRVSCFRYGYSRAGRRTPAGLVEQRAGFALSSPSAELGTAHPAFILRQVHATSMPPPQRFPLCKAVCVV